MEDHTDNRKSETKGNVAFLLRYGRYFLERMGRLRTTDNDYR